MHDLYLSSTGSDRVLGWTARGFHLRNQDAAIFATLSRVYIKDLAAHLYKAARGKVNSALHLWGPLTTLILVGDHWPLHCQLAATPQPSRCGSFLAGLWSSKYPAVHTKLLEQVASLFGSLDQRGKCLQAYGQYSGALGHHPTVRAGTGTYPRANPQSTRLEAGDPACSEGWSPNAWAASGCPSASPARMC